MTRALTAAIQTAIASPRHEFVHLLEVVFSGGTEYLTTGSRNLDWNGQTWVALGGMMKVGPLEESDDPQGQGIAVEVCGIDQAIVGDLLNNHYRGRALRAWMAFLDTANGTVIADPIPLFDGLQLDNYEVTEQVTRDRPGTVTITTRGRLSMAINQVSGIATSLHGHQHYYGGDTFFRHVAKLPFRKVYWGTESPQIIITGGTPGGGKDKTPGGDTLL